MASANQAQLGVLFTRILRLGRLLTRAGQGAGGFLAAHLRLLQLIAANEAVSVPHLARLLGTSRQNVQLISDRLLDDGHIEARDNPAHKRSPLFRLTPRGAELLSDVKRQEAVLLQRLDVSEAELDGTLEVLAQVSAALESVQSAQIREIVPRAQVARKRPPVSVPEVRSQFEEPAGELPVSLL